MKNMKQLFVYSNLQSFQSKNKNLFWMRYYVHQIHFFYSLSSEFAFGSLSDMLSFLSFWRECPRNLLLWYNLQLHHREYYISCVTFIGFPNPHFPKKNSLSHRLTPGASHTHGTPFHVWVRLSWDRSVQLLGSKLQPWVRVLLGPSWSLRLWSSVPIGGPPVTQSQQLKIICLNFWWVMIFDPCWSALKHVWKRIVGRVQIGLLPRPMYRKMILAR